MKYGELNSVVNSSSSGFFVYVDEDDVIPGIVDSTDDGGHSHGSVYSTQPRWYFLPVVIVPLWILVGNCLVLLAVIRQRSLRTLSNWVIASLALTDFLLALLVVPLGVYQLVAGSWQLGLYICLAWTGSDVVLSTTSIMHLCAIALYRYNGIAHPLRVRSTQDARHVAALVVPSWTIAFALSIPFAAQGIADPSHVLTVVETAGSVVTSTTQPEPEVRFINDVEEVTQAAIMAVTEITPTAVECGIFNRTFAIYSSLVSFFIPLAIMIFADARSIQILRRNVQLNLNQTPASTTFRSSTTAANDCQSTAAAATSSAIVVADRDRDNCSVGGGGGTSVMYEDRRCRSPWRCTDRLHDRARSTPNVVDREPSSSGSGCCRTSGVAADYNFLFVDASPGRESLSVSAFGSYLGGGSSGNGNSYGSVKFVAGGSGSIGNVSIQRSPPAHIGHKPFPLEEATAPLNPGDEPLLNTPLRTGVGRGRAEITPLPVRQNRKEYRQQASTTYVPCSTPSNCTAGLGKGRLRSKSVVYINMLASGGSRTVAGGTAAGGSGGGVTLMKVNSRERRAERTLIWVFVAFVVLWLPFFCTNLAYGLCQSCRVPDGLFGAFTWLGYLSSGVNPCIYTYLNRDFRKAFRNILACRSRRRRYGDNLTEGSRAPPSRLPRRFS